MPALGTNIFISTSGGSVIAGTRSNELNVGCNTIEIASGTQQEWEEHIKGRKSWSMTVAYLVTTVKGTWNPLSVGTTYTLHFMTRGNSNDSVSGQAICTNCKINAVTGNLCTGSITFKGTGPLS